MKSMNGCIRRISILLLAAILCASSLASCGSANAETDEETSAITTAETTAAADSLSARSLVLDDVPAYDFEGETYRIFYQKRYTTDAIAEEETGDVLNDAVYMRNRTVSERFNVEIIGVEGEEESMAKTIMNSVAAGDDEYDLYMGHSLYSGQAALGGYFLNWYDIPYMDFSKPWFPQFAIEGLTLNGRMYMSVADMCLSLVSNVYCMYFDKMQAESYGMPDIYSIVTDGNWTVAQLKALTKDIYTDINGDGKRDSADTYGFASEINTTLATWIYACDQPTVLFSADGNVSVAFNCEKTVNIIEKLKNLFFDDVGSYCKSCTFDDQVLMFNNGSTVFASGGVGDAESSYRARESDYGIIPYPKYDEAQDNYYTIPGGSVSCIAVPATSDNTVLVGAVTAALCRESWISVLPAYYDIVLKVKGARDEVSISMLDIIMDGRMVDTSFIYDSWKGYNYKLNDLINGSKELASYCAANDAAVLKHYQKVVDLFFS